MLTALDTSGLAPGTLLIVTADHGGIGTQHGGESMAELEIPWIIYGPGVVAGKEITDPVNTYDTAATIAFALGLEPPYHWIARPVLSAFVGYSDQAPSGAATAYVPMPRIRPEGGLLETTGSVRLSVDHPDAIVHYTTDGTNPTRSSPRYNEPVRLLQATRLRARAFHGTTGASASTDALFLSEHNGIRVSYYEGSFDRLPDFEATEAVRVDTVYGFDLNQVATRSDYYALRFEAVLAVDTPGAYTFHLGSDDGSNLYLNGELLIDNDGSGGARRKSATVSLEPGRYTLVVDYFETYGDEVLDVAYEGPDFGRQSISPLRLLLPE